MLMLSAMHHLELLDTVSTNLKELLSLQNK
nr:MAG TPA: hypothetical protein [Caudoviricetes sp.]